MQLEQEFQARIAQAKEAARLASIAAAARSSNVSNGRSFASTVATSDVPVHHVPNADSFTTSIESFPVENVPFEVKNRIDRLVEFVARNGDVFEATARKRERENPDFAFLRPGGPFSAYYQWKKQQMCRHSSPAAAFTSSDPSRSSFDASSATASTLLSTTDPLGEMSVGAMANVCKYARASGVQTYTPIPQDVIRNVGNLPPVEPARLEIRMSEFYRHEKKSNRRE
ncbi:hypothetical protein DD238_003181 [Peronospora effusa]|uniref:SURP motif domain-containing protein n=1 Tax=Peronospora effusa TaxID=542832 RepID=A0A3M6VEK1_9STRA|nr:hypothetical protein DD238_003181 [Peronospora effusa]